MGYVVVHLSKEDRDRFDELLEVMKKIERNLYRLAGDDF